MHILPLLQRGFFPRNKCTCYLYCKEVGFFSAGNKCTRCLYCTVYLQRRGPSHKDFCRSEAAPAPLAKHIFSQREITLHAPKIKIIYFFAGGKTHSLPLLQIIFFSRGRLLRGEIFQEVTTREFAPTILISVSFDVPTRSHPGTLR